MFVEDLSSKYPKLSPYGTSVCGRTRPYGWLRMDRTAAVLDILNSNFQQTSIETTLETLQARKSGVICDAMLPKFLQVQLYTGPLRLP